MNAESIGRDLELTLLKYKRGLIPLSQAKEELSFTLALLKAYDMASLEQRIEKLEDIYEARKEQRKW